MAFTYGFYDSVNHDRLYNSVQFGELFEGILNDGVYKGYWNEFHVAPSGELSVSVDTGRAWFDNTWSRNTSLYYLDLEQSDSRLDRYDVVVLEVNHTKNTRKNELKIIKGELSVSPTKPVLIIDSNTKQFPLAYIYRHAGINIVYDSDITQAVGTSECPYASLTASFSSGGSTESVNAIPNEWITGLFDPDYILNPDNNSYYLNIVGLRTLVNEIKSLDFGDGSGGTGCGSGTGVCLGDEHTFSINTIPDDWITGIFENGLPEDHENCAHFLDENGLLTFSQTIQSYLESKLSEYEPGGGSSSDAGTVLYHNESGTFEEVSLADAVTNYRTIEVYYRETPENVDVNASYSKPETAYAYKIQKISVATGTTSYSNPVSFHVYVPDVANADTSNCSLRFYESAVYGYGSVLSFGGTYKLVLNGTAGGAASFYKYTTNYDDSNQLISVVKVVGYK